MKQVSRWLGFVISVVISVVTSVVISVVILLSCHVISIVIWWYHSQVLDELEKQQDMRAVDAALKRHETVSAEVHSGVSASAFISICYQLYWISSPSWSPGGEIASSYSCREGADTGKVSCCRRYQWQVRYQLSKYRSLFLSLLTFTLSVRLQNIDFEWERLLEALTSTQKMLSSTHDLMAIFIEMDECLASMAEIEVKTSLAYTHPLFHS